MHFYSKNKYDNCKLSNPDKINKFRDKSWHNMVESFIPNRIIANHCQPKEYFFTRL